MARLTVPGPDRPAGPGRALVAALAALVAALAVTGCVSMPSAGPVQSYPVTQGADAQNQPYPQIITGPPGRGWSPTQIVEGFLTASASVGDHRQVARTYLTAEASKDWHPSWSAVVYQKGPNVKGPAYPAGGDGNQATVTVSGHVAAYLSGHGKYAVPSASAPAGHVGSPPTFHLAKVGGQWRISSAPRELLLTNDSFHSDYQLRNLYFFDPTDRFLVPDPVYVPLRATPEDLVNGLVYDLINQPDDWLYGATRTAFPQGTKLIGDVTLDGVTAIVNLGGRAITKASSQTLRQVSAQLLWTLVGSGQAGQSVQSVEVELKGKPWIPDGSQGNPVQSRSKYHPASGASKTFYYLDGSGDVMRGSGTTGKPVKVERIGTGFSQIAVSPGGKYLAALKQGILYTGRLGHTLAKRAGTGYATMSWDPNGDLWVTTGGQSNQVYMLRADATTKQQLGQRTAVTVLSSDGSGSVPGPYTELRVAPDGVRVAVVIGGTALNFGAISSQPGANPGEATLRIMLSPFYVPRPGIKFTSLSWYGSGDVITLAQPGPYVTEYPVNGGPATDIPAEPQMSSITASTGSPLIAGLARAHMVADPSLTGSWMPIGDGTSPVYPG